MGPHALLNSSFWASLRYQYQGCFALIVNSAKMPSRGALMLAHFAGGTADMPAANFSWIESGVELSTIAPLASNRSLRQMDGFGSRIAWYRAVAASNAHIDFRSAAVYSGKGGSRRVGRKRAARSAASRKMSLSTRAPYA